MSDMKNRAGCAKIAQPYNKLGMTEPAPPRKLMTDPSSSGGGDQPLGLIELPQRQKVVLVMDLVESVRLMAANERAVIDHWRGFVQHATADVLPRHRGRMVKSLGDGIMAEFDSARDGTNAALALQRFFDGANATLPHDQQLYLRAGLNATHVYVDDIDIYGSGVNLAARVAGLAGPGEVMVTAEVRDGLTDGLDAVVEDMGECYLKHVAEPVRAYRVGAASSASRLVPVAELANALEPTIAVIPLSGRGEGPGESALGDLIADILIYQLSRNRHLKVISRLSSAHLRERPSAPMDAKALLGANYAIAGSFALSGSRITAYVEVVELTSQSLVWADRQVAEVEDLFQPESQMGLAIAESVSREIFRHEVRYTAMQPIPTLPSYRLLLGAITLMHRAGRADFLRARQLIERLIELHARNPQPYAWMGMWYVLQAAQGWSSDVAADSEQARVNCMKALDLDAGSALALAINGQVHGYIRKDLDAARGFYQDAIAANPNESLAWLWLGMNHGFKGEGGPGVAATERALSLSPLDPIRYYYETLAASTAVAAGDYPRVIELAQSSIRLNRRHSSSYRSLAIGQALSGDEDAARLTLKQLLELEPGFSVSQFIARMPGTSYAPGYASKLADALRRVGLPD